MKTDHPDDDRLVAFTLDELEAVESDRVAAHADECDECRRAVDTYRSVTATLRNTPAPDASAGMLASLLQAQAAANRPSPVHVRGWLLRPAPVWGLAVVVIVSLMAGFWAGRNFAVEPRDRPPDATVVDRSPGQVELPEPPRIPFASA